MDAASSANDPQRAGTALRGEESDDEKFFFRTGMIHRLYHPLSPSFTRFCANHY